MTRCCWQPGQTRTTTSRFITPSTIRGVTCPAPGASRGRHPGRGTNALAKVLDYDNLAGLRMLLAHTQHADPDLGRILHWAIYRGRSAAHVRALLDAGADPRALNFIGKAPTAMPPAPGCPR